MASFAEKQIMDRLFQAMTTDVDGNVALRTVAEGLAADSVKDTQIDWGTGALQVSAADVPLADVGTYFTTDNVEAALQQLAAAVAAAGAPEEATYIVQVANGTLTNAQVLGALATGIVKNTTTTGVLSIAAQGTDYWAPGGTDVAVADGGTGSSTAADARTALGLAIGTNVQAYDAELAAIAGLVSAANKLPYFTGIGTAALADLSVFGRSLIDDDTNTTARSTLGLGTIATQAADNVAITGGSITGITDLTVADGGTGVSTLTGLVKGNGTSAFSAASLGTDYYGPSGTDVAVADGGTGASNASGARSNLGAAVNGVNGDITQLTAIAAATGGIVMGPHGTSAGNTTEIRFKELAANGTNYVGFKAPDQIDADKIWVLPSADGAAGQGLQTDGAGNLQWDASGLSFGTGADGATNWTTGANLDPSTTKNYTTSTLPVGQTLSVSSVNTTLHILNTSDVTINGAIDLNGKGGAGGAGGATASADGLNGTAGDAFAGSAYDPDFGSAGANGPIYGAGGGASIREDGGDGYNAANSGGTRGTASDAVLAILASVFTGMVACGGGGGGGRAATQASPVLDGGAGGAGGGALIWFIGGDLTLGASSSINVGGVAGGAGDDDPSDSTKRSGAGGGGGGGVAIILVSGSITNSGVTLTAPGGAAGSVQYSDQGGAGAGGDGQIIIYSISTGQIITSIP